MTSHVDSAPYLIQRAGEISLSSRISDALKAKGVTTLAQLAFCVGQPGQVLNPTDFETWSDALLRGMTVGEKASLRRLILEAQTMLVASLKDMAEPSEGAAPKKVGVAERNARMDQLRTQLSGVSLTGQLEPSHALLDMAVQQWESRCLKYIGPEKCHSREDEVQNTKPLTTNLSLEGGKLKVTESEGIEDRDIEGSLQVLNALRRRGVAYAFARLISWEKHEAYVACLFKYLTKPAQQGYRKVSLRQILRADKLAFSKMSEAGEDIRADAPGDLPLDKLIATVLQDYDLIVALLPLGDVLTGSPARIGVVVVAARDRILLLNSTRARVAKARGTGAPKVMIRGVISRVRHMLRARISLAREKDTAAANRSGSRRAFATKGRQRGTARVTRIATASTWVPVLTRIARKETTSALFLSVEATIRWESVP